MINIWREKTQLIYDWIASFDWLHILTPWNNGPYLFLSTGHLNGNYVCLIYGCKGRSCIALGGSNKLAIHSPGTSANPGLQMVCTAHQGPQTLKYMCSTSGTTAGSLCRLWMRIGRGSSRLHGTPICRCCCPSRQTSSLECTKYFHERGLTTCEVLHIFSRKPSQNFGDLDS